MYVVQHLWYAFQRGRASVYSGKCAFTLSSNPLASRSCGSGEYFHVLAKWTSASTRLSYLRPVILCRRPSSVVRNMRPITLMLPVLYRKTFIARLIGCLAPRMVREAMCAVFDTMKWHSTRCGPTVTYGQMRTVE